VNTDHDHCVYTNMECLRNKSPSKHNCCINNKLVAHKYFPLTAHSVESETVRHFSDAWKKMEHYLFKNQLFNSCLDIPSYEIAPPC
jgi:hypothetical protein